MTYIVHHRIKGDHIGGHFNLPRGTICECVDGFIQHNGKPICRETSRTADEFFSVNDDWKGLERGALAYAIALSPRWKEIDKQGHTARFSVDEQEVIREKYGQFLKQEDPIIFNYDFYHADVDELREMAETLGIKVKE